MGLPVPLTKDVFETWRAGHDQNMAGIKEDIGHILVSIEKERDRQLAVNQNVTERVLVLETYRKRDVLKLSAMATVISSLIAGAVALLRG